MLITTRVTTRTLLHSKRVSKHGRYWNVLSITCWSTPLNPESVDHNTFKNKRCGSTSFLHHLTPLKFELHDESKQWKDGITLSSDKVINTLLFCYIGLQYNIPDHSGHPRATSEYKCHCLVFILGLFCLVFSRKMRVNFHPNDFSLLLVWILTGIGELQVYFQFFCRFYGQILYDLPCLWFVISESIVLCI